jgi:hypothetical protein
MQVKQLNFPHHPSWVLGKNMSIARIPGCRNIVRLAIFGGIRLPKFRWYVSNERKMWVTFRRLMLQNLLLRSSVIGWIVLGSFGLKYMDFTSSRFSCCSANGKSM